MPCFQRLEEELMQISLNGKRTVVTGGSKGIGRSIALAFAAAGAAVSICARGQTALEATANEISAHGVKAHAGVCDLGDKAAIAAYIAAAAASLGGIATLVNTASGCGGSDDATGCAKISDVGALPPVRAA